jgi:hypothetical protein
MLSPISGGILPVAQSLITAESHGRIIDGLVERHSPMMRQEGLRVAARLDDRAVIVTLVLARHDQSFEYTMEVGFDVPEDDSVATAAALDLCVDFLDWYLGEYFREERDLLLPLDWQPHRFGEHSVVARGDVRNPLLDDAADAWLRGERPEVEPPRRK